MPRWLGSLGETHHPFLLPPSPPNPRQVVKAGTHATAQKFEEGDVVGIGWHGNHCHSCESCTEGDFMLCDTKQITGLHFGGGYQQ